MLLTMKQLLQFLLFLPLINFAQTGISVQEMSHCDTQMQNFLTTYDIPGATFALAKDGKLVYSRAYGTANVGGSETTQPHHMFRIASVSKPITSIGIMKMIENGSIAITDQVFGSGGILENHWYFTQANITDNRIYDITVQNLLEHTGGWDRNINCFPNPTAPYPWFFGGCDPIVAPLHITNTFGVANPAQEEHLIRYVLEQTLDYDPGTTYAYSNMGFLILSEIIEEVSGMDYESWMQQEIFHPLGIYDMYIGKNKLEDKIEREGEYVGNGYSTLDLYGSGDFVLWEYGGFNLEAMDGHGGWIATARDLARLLVAIDGFATKPDILSSTSISTMTTPSSAFQFYAKGWQVNGANNWWHSGALDGTASYFVRTNSGYTWAIILNKRVIDGNANAFWGALDGLGWNCIAGTTTFPTHDLFEAPTVNSSDIQASNITTESADLSWTNGNGTARIVVAKQLTNSTRNNNFQSYPLDGNDYTANNQYGLGDDLGDGSFVIYNGNGNSVTLNGLSEGSEYAIRVYEYTKNTANGNNALYLLGDTDEITVLAETLSIDDRQFDQNIIIYPNPSTANVIIKNNSQQKLLSAVVMDVNGRIVSNIDLSDMKLEKRIPLGNYASGLYFIKISSENNFTLKQLIKQ